MNRRREFDALWNWPASHMRYREGPCAGYFRWLYRRAGGDEDTPPASDGEAYLATALFMACGRWGEGRGLYAYARQAHVMLHKQDMNSGVVDGVNAMFDRRARQVVFVPYGRSAGFTNPSNYLPVFKNCGPAGCPAGAATERGIGDAGRRSLPRAAPHSTGRRTRLPVSRPITPSSTAGTGRTTDMAISASASTVRRRTGPSTRPGGTETRTPRP